MPGCIYAGSRWIPQALENRHRFMDIPSPDDTEELSMLAGLEQFGVHLAFITAINWSTTYVFVLEEAPEHVFQTAARPG